jgi:NADPH-dependent 2,4-dienoyl-CoA reductase/sulfur reductase-like enzyme
MRHRDRERATPPLSQTPDRQWRASRRLESPGANLPGVFSLRSLSDSTLVREAASEAREALVIGGGFIGMEVAASLRHLGLEVTLINRASGLFQALEAPELEREVAIFFADTT